MLIGGNGWLGEMRVEDFVYPTVFFFSFLVVSFVEGIHDIRYFLF